MSPTSATQAILLAPLHDQRGHHKTAREATAAQAPEQLLNQHVERLQCRRRRGIELNLITHVCLSLSRTRTLPVTPCWVTPAPGLVGTSVRTTCAFSDPNNWDGLGGHPWDFQNDP